MKSGLNVFVTLFPDHLDCANMKIVIFLFCFTTTALAVGEKQLHLEDIERDNLATERKLKSDKHPSPKYSSVTPSTQLSPQPKILPQSQLDYGFTPLKPNQKYPPQSLQAQPQQYQIPQTLQYVYPQFSYPQISYPQIPQYQYQQYENVPYVVGNHLVHSAKSDQQQYYDQQLLYIQPTIAPSNNIQMVVDPNGEVKYYMYVPSQYYSEVKSTDDPIKSIQVQTTPPTYHNVGPQIFTREPDYRQFPKTESQYITQPQLPPQPVTQPIQYIQPSPTVPPTPTEYVSPVTTQEPFVASQQLIQPTDIPKSQYVPKGEPQSLLDSYVPSILQLQYYKQQQQQQGRVSSESGKNLVARAPSTRQTLRIPNAEIETNYNFQLPSPYRSHSFKN